MLSDTEFVSREIRCLQNNTNVTRNFEEENHKRNCNIWVSYRCIHVPNLYEEIEQLFKSLTKQFW
jgi:hypothetical protein